eukprot:196399-Alexandrium_andersonii.AAC.1
MGVIAAAEQDRLDEFRLGKRADARQRRRNEHLDLRAVVAIMHDALAHDALRLLSTVSSSCVLIVLHFKRR